MTLAQLLDEAHAAGLRVHTDDGVKLTIRGPQEAGALARLLLARKTEVLAELAGVTCCGQRMTGTAGAPLVNACQLCPHSATYWQGPAHCRPAPPAATEPPAVLALSAAEMPVPPALAAARPGLCGAGTTPCDEPARLYPCGWRCDQHAPASTSGVTP